MSGLTLKDRRVAVSIERDVIKSLQFDLVRIREAIKQSRKNIKEHQAVLADERKFARIVKEEQRHLRARKQAETMHARIAKMEAKLTALKVKAAA